MMTPESFGDAINKSMAEVRKAMQETAERLEAEFRRVAAAAGVDERASADRIKASNEQLREMVDSLRVEASRAAGQFSEGMNDMMGDFRRLIEATMPGWGDGTEQRAEAPEPATAAPVAEPAPAPATKASKKATAKKATKKKATKTPAAKKSAKKATRKSAKKSTAMEASAEKSAKKATKKATNKATKKATKKATRKSTAKKAR